MKKAALAAIVWCVASAVLLAGEKETPSGRIFYASFDGTLDAVESRGDGRAELREKALFTGGQKGQAVVVGDVYGGLGIWYSTEGNLDLERGTVCLWVQPMNWCGDDSLYHNLVSVTVGEKGNFLLYKYWNPAQGLTFYVDPDESPRNKMYCSTPIREWGPGQWRHVAIAWTRHEGMVLYLEGKPAASLAGAGLCEKPMKGRMRVGSDWQRKGSRTAVDELMTFERMLAPHEIAGLAGAGAPGVEEARDIPGVALAHAILGQRVLARVYRDCLGSAGTTGEGEALDTARLSLVNVEKQSEVAGDLGGRVKEAALTKALTTMELKLEGIPRGVYEARLAVLSKGTVRGVETLRVSKETEDNWKTAAQLGKEDMVLPPFRPMKIQGNAVRCSGPGYEFDGAGLVRRAQAGGDEPLAGGVRVCVNAGGGETRLKEGTLRVETASDTEVRLRGQMEGEALGIVSEAKCRYDGTVWTTLRFRPRWEVEMTGLRIAIPIRTVEAKYLAYIALARIDAKRLGYDALPEGEGIVWSREFMPSVWIGSEDRGVGWYAESDEFWDTEGEDALTVERRKEESALWMNVIRKPRKVSKEFKIEFGLQATPIRELAGNWRSYQGVPVEEITNFFYHLRKRPYPRPELEGKRPRGKVCYLSNYHTHFTCTLPRDPEEFREMVRRAKGYGLLGTPYTDVTLHPENAGDMWMRGQELCSRPGARASVYGPVCSIGVCHGGPFADWFVWYASHLIREYGANGIYLDEMWPHGCSNATHGCGYVGADGQRRVTFPLRAYLETFRRIRALFTATKQPFWIMNHISGGRVPPLPTFGDSLLMAEDLYGAVERNPDYTDT